MGPQPNWKAGRSRWMTILIFYVYGEITPDLATEIRMPGLHLWARSFYTRSYVFCTKAYWWRARVENPLWQLLIQWRLWSVNEEGGFYRDGHLTAPWR